MRNVLIISYYFPPSPGVGGRRWAKFSKYLSQDSNYKIHVLTSQNKVKNKVSAFMRDVDHSKISVTELPPRYPRFLQHMEYPEKGIVASVGFRVQRIITSWLTPGNYFDYTVFWKGYFEREIPDLIRRENIQDVIISGPPFRYVLYSLKLKEKFPDIQLIYDCRDPWVDPNHPPTISLKRHAFEAAAELKVLLKVDKILAVSDFQQKQLLAKAPKIAPVFVLPNGYDLDDIPSNLPAFDGSGNGIRIAHFGVLHETKDYYLKPFIAALEKLKIADEELFNRIELDFIGLCPESIQNALRKTGVRFLAPGVLEITEAYQRLNRANLVLWFKYDGSAGDFATKFGDYIALKKFMWTFSVRGAVTDYIEKHKIGYNFFRDDVNLENSIREAFLKMNDEGVYTFNPDYNANELNCLNLTNDLKEILQN